LKERGNRERGKKHHPHLKGVKEKTGTGPFQVADEGVEKMKARAVGGGGAAKKLAAGQKGKRKNLVEIGLPRREAKRRGC